MGAFSHGFTPGLGNVGSTSPASLRLLLENCLCNPGIPAAQVCTSLCARHTAAHLATFCPHSLSLLSTHMFLIEKRG